VRQTTYGEVVPSNRNDGPRAEELQDLLSQLGTAAQLAGSFLYVEDRFPDGRVVAVYDAVGFGALFGDPSLTDVVWREHVLADDEAILAGLGALRPGDAFDVRYRRRGVDGRVRVVRDRGRAIETAAGAVRVFGAAIDVTGETEMRATVQRIGETIDEYYFTDELRPDGTYEPIFATSAIHRLLGGIPDGLTYGEAWHAAVHPDDRALAASLAPRLRAGEPVDVEYRLVGFDGVTRWVWVRCAVRETLADGTRILDGVAQDVTARRDAQTRLSEIAEAIDEVLYVEEHYADGSIVETYSTRGIHKLYGIGPDDPVPPWRPHVHPEDVAISDQLDENLRRLVPSDLQYRLIGVDGRTRWIRDRVRPRLRADGVVIAEGILADVTAEKEALLALEAARAEADRLARVDPLTGAFNRRHFSEALDGELARAARQGTGTGLLAVDIDHFKVLNDLHGHTIGDEVLVHVAGRIADALRGYDTLARWGGEEFVILLPGFAGRDDLLSAGERVREAVESGPAVIRGSRFPLTVSVGAASADPADADPGALVERADRALYAAKNAGRNCVVLHDDLVGAGVLEPVSVRLARTFAISAGAREGMPPNHLEDVAELSSRVALQLRLSSIDAVRCRLAGWLHDVGKVAVPDHILNKPGPLTDDEWEIMREHVVIGEHLVRQVPELADAASGVRHHHERWDGTGYPDRLSGDAIPLAARIVAVVDAYSAMTSPRVYSKARSTFAAVAELERCAGSHFDPAVVAAFVRVLEVAGIAASSA
jgi:diguanylate cyclase (GGDEF)-like protein